MTMKIGLCMTCGNRFLDGDLHSPVDNDARVCCQQINSDGGSNVELFDLDDVDSIRELVLDVFRKSVKPGAAFDILCGMCQSAPPTTWIFNVPYDDRERLCDPCVAKYNRAIWAGQDPSLLLAQAVLV